MQWARSVQYGGLKRAIVRPCRAASVEGCISLCGYVLNGHYSTPSNSQPDLSVDCAVVKYTSTFVQECLLQVSAHFALGPVGIAPSSAAPSLLAGDAHLTSSRRQPEVAQTTAHMWTRCFRCNCHMPSASASLSLLAQTSPDDSTESRSKPASPSHLTPCDDRTDPTANRAE